MKEARQRRWTSVRMRAYLLSVLRLNGCKLTWTARESKVTRLPSQAPSKNIENENASQRQIGLASYGPEMFFDFYYVLVFE
eukprot:6176939-Pleurochrysis_carterae.AAC.2